MNKVAFTTPSRNNLAGFFAGRPRHLLGLLGLPCGVQDLLSRSADGVAAATELKHPKALSLGKSSGFLRGVCVSGSDLERVALCGILLSLRQVAPLFINDLDVGDRHLQDRQARGASGSLVNSITTRDLPSSSSGLGVSSPGPLSGGIGCGGRI